MNVLRTVIVVIFLLFILVFSWAFSLTESGFKIMCNASPQTICESWVNSSISKVDKKQTGHLIPSLLYLKEGDKDIVLSQENIRKLKNTVIEWGEFGAPIAPLALLVLVNINEEELNAWIFEQAMYVPELNLYLDKNGFK